MKKSILLTVIKGTIIASFFTPLIISNKFIFPFVFPKTAAFQILIEIMFFAWLLLAAEYKEFRPTRSKIFWALSFFMFVIFLASVLGVNFGLSFWSSYERMTGLITMFHYFVFFLVLASVLKTKKDWFMIFDSFIIGGLLLAFFGLGQKLNLSGFVLAGQGRVSATFGNAAYYGAYILFNLFFITFMFFQRRQRNARIYYAAAFFFNLLILYWTETRGALLGFGAALILFVLALIFWPGEGEEKETIISFRKKIKKIALAVAIFFVIFVSLVYLFKNSALIKSSPTLSRLTSISLQEATTQTRLLAWKLSMKGFLERPVLGWGWENYNVVFNKYYDPNLYPTESWFDRAHNVVVDTLISSGAIGLISFFGIFAAAWWVLWRAFCRKKIDFLNGALFAILPLAYLIQDLFVFDMLFSYMPLFMFLAFINWVGKNDVAAAKKEAVVAKSNMLIKIVLVGALIFFIYFVNVKPGLAGYWGIQAMSGQNQGLGEVENDFKKSLAYGTFGRFEVRMQLFETARILMGNYQNSEDKKSFDDFVRFALDEGDKNLKERPLDARYALLIGQLNLSAAQLDQSRLLRAEEIIKNTVNQNPNRQLTLFALGQITMAEGKKDESIGYFKKAVQANDKVAESHLNLALVYFSFDETENGRKELALLEEKFGDSAIGVNGYMKIAQIFESQKNYNDAINYLEKAVVLAPNNASPHAALAGLWAEVGDKNNAKEEALKAGELDPSLKSAVDEFIKSLGL